MYVVISGGGKVGSYLARNLLKKGQRVAIIEKRSEVLEKLADRLHLRDDFLPARQDPVDFF